MGLDRLKLFGAVVAALALAGCGGGRPERLLSGKAARPVEHGVRTEARVVTRVQLGARFDGCRAEAGEAPIVERVGVVGESLTIQHGDTLSACDGGVDPAGEFSAPWCGSVVGRISDRKLLDPRLDILCEDRDGNPLAYAFVAPVAQARWIGVDQGSYVELYEVIADVPVRVASTRGIDLDRAQATFEITQYDQAWRELASYELKAAVAG